MADLVPFAEDQVASRLQASTVFFMGANGTCSTPTIVLIQQQCRRMVSSELAQLWRGTRTCTDTSVDILHESADNHIQEIDPNHRKNIPKSLEPRCRRRTTVAGYATQDINKGHHHGWRCPRCVMWLCPSMDRPSSEMFNRSAPRAVQVRTLEGLRERGWCLLATEDTSSSSSH